MPIKESALLFSARNRDMAITGNGINFAFDILTQESHSWKVTPSTHPVQKGSPFTDHIKKEIRTGNITGFITNFGLKRGELESNYAQDAFDLLENYRDNVVPVTIVTTLKVYENYIITKVGAERNGSSGEAQFFPISFQEFRNVKLRDTEGIGKIDIPSSELGNGDTASADAEQASPNADTGEQTAEDPVTAGSGKLERFFNFTDFASGSYK